MTLTMRATLAARHVDVDLRLDDGERVALLGPNGAGKSTVLAILAGILRPDAGRAELDGRVLFDLDAAAGGALVGAVDAGHRDAGPGSAPLPAPDRTGQRRLRTPSSRGEQHSCGAADRRSVADRGGGQEFATRKPAQLSGGQAQRVAIARALAASPHAVAAGRADGGARRRRLRRRCAACCGRCWRTGRRSSSPMICSTHCCWLTAARHGRAAGSWRRVRRRR